MSLPRQILSKSLKGIYLFGENLYQKIPIWQFYRLYAHIFKATTVKFGVRLRTWDTVPAPNFVFNKSLKGPAGIALPSRGDAY